VIVLAVINALAADRAGGRADEVSEMQRARRFRANPNCVLANFEIAGLAFE
jgi:hypothetical protein